MIETCCLYVWYFDEIDLWTVICYLLFLDDLLMISLNIIVFDHHTYFTDD